MSVGGSDSEQFESRLGRAKSAALKGEVVHVSRMDWQNTTHSSTRSFGNEDGGTASIWLCDKALQNTHSHSVSPSLINRRRAIQSRRCVAYIALSCFRERKFRGDVTIPQSSSRLSAMCCTTMLSMSFLTESKRHDNEARGTMRRTTR